MTIDGLDRRPPRSGQAKRIKKSEFVGKGCLLQGVGLLCPFIGFAALGVVGAAVGLLAALGLFIAGGRQAITWRCSACMNPLADGRVRVCPVCKEALE